MTTFAFRNGCDGTPISENLDSATDTLGSANPFEPVTLADAKRKAVEFAKRHPRLLVSVHRVSERELFSVMTDESGRVCDRDGRPLKNQNL